MVLIAGKFDFLPILVVFYSATKQVDRRLGVRRRMATQSSAEIAFGITMDDHDGATGVRT